MATEQKERHPRKCAVGSCWHYKAQGIIYCMCCLHGRYNTIPVEDR